ncbi:MAG: hypothetical protein Fur0010_19590 [Bdellovibrio sp.]
MDDKTKLYVFHKKEVLLIFLLMLLMAVTSFMLGVKVGKDYTFTKAGFTKEDRTQVDLLSTEEEAVNKLMQEKSGAGEEPKKVDIEGVHQTLEEKIRQELEQENQKFNDAKTPAKEEAPKPMTAPTEKPVMASAGTMPEQPAKANDPYSGKFTIQLGSHRSIKDAEDFAQGFKVRGYNPIVSEVEIAGRGTWFRVSLGAFDNISEAKDYIIKEKSLFQGQDYVITRFE